MGIPISRMRNRILAKLAGYSSKEVRHPDGGTRWQVRRSDGGDQGPIGPEHPDEEAALAAALLLAETNPLPPASSSPQERWFFHSRAFRARDTDDMGAYQQALEDFPPDMSFSPGLDFRAMYPEDSPVAVTVTWTEGAEILRRTVHGPDEFARVMLEVLERRLKAGLYEGNDVSAAPKSLQEVAASPRSIVLGSRDMDGLRHSGRRAFRFLRNRAEDYPAEKVLVEALASAVDEPAIIEVKENR